MLLIEDFWGIFYFTVIQVDRYNLLFCPKRYLVYHTVNVNSVISFLPLCFELCLFKSSSLEVPTDGAQHFSVRHLSCQYLYKEKKPAMKSFTCRRDKLSPVLSALLPSHTLFLSSPLFLFLLPQPTPIYLAHIWQVMLLGNITVKSRSCALGLV